LHHPQLRHEEPVNERPNGPRARRIATLSARRSRNPHFFTTPEGDRSMTIKRLSPGKRLSGAVVHDNTVYLAGQVAGDSSAGVKGQTEQILKKMDELLAAAGTDKSKLLSATIWISNMGNFAEMNEAWDAWVDPNNTPARATVEARLAN